MKPLKRFPLHAAFSGMPLPDSPKPFKRFDPCAGRFAPTPAGPLKPFKRFRGPLVCRLRVRQPFQRFPLRGNGIPWCCANSFISSRNDFVLCVSGCFARYPATFPMMVCETENAW